MLQTFTVNGRDVRILLRTLGIRLRDLALTRERIMATLLA
jgi:hypothetical protein